MRAFAIRAFLLAVGLVMPSPRCFSQEVVDRIAARVENDVILLSDIRALSRYQQFLDGKSETDDQILDLLIDQWIVRTEAEVARSPQPSDAEIEKSLTRLRGSFLSNQEYEARKKQLGIADQEIRAMAAMQLYLSNYLDSRFRPAVQIEPKAIEDFYKNAVVPRAKARGQEPPSLETSRDPIQEALVQEGINQQAERWLKESRLRLHVENLLDQGAK
jgi:hypothetical protein